MAPCTVVTSVSSDAHTWNLVYLQLVLEELGHQVTNLGPCVPDTELVAHCVRLRPDLVVVSTVNGHGARDGARVIRTLRARPELAGTTVVIGGKLDTAGGTDSAVTRRLLAAGFDAVFGEDVTAFRAFLAEPALAGVG